MNERDAEEANERFVALLGSLILTKGGVAPSHLAVTVTTLPTRKTVMLEGYGEGGSGKADASAAVAQSLDVASNDGHSSNSANVLAFGAILVAMVACGLVVYLKGRRTRSKFGVQVTSSRAGSRWSGSRGGGASGARGFDGVMSSPTADGIDDDTGGGSEGRGSTYTVSVDVDSVDDAEDDWDAISTTDTQQKL
jgi:hypothetical protein